MCAIPISCTDIESCSIRLLKDGEEDKWDAFLDRRKGVPLYHRALWRKLIRHVFGHETYYLYAQSETNSLVGVLPLVRLKSRFFGDFLVSMPYFNYGGVIAATNDVAEKLMKYACQLAKELRVGHIEFRDTVRRDNDWSLRDDKVVMELELPTTVEALWSGFTSKLRAQIKRPVREGVEVSRGRGELIPAFYQVFSRNMRDLGTPAYSMAFFSAIADAFPKSAYIVLVRRNEQPVAAGFLLGHEDRLEIPWASSIGSANSIGVNMLLYWEVLKLAIENGYHYFDFGRSTVNSGTYRFKKQWGAQARQLYWYYWLNDGTTMPQLTPDNPKYRLAIKMWQHLPLFLANWLGPKIVKNLP